MAYDSTKLNMVVAGPIASGPRLWTHTSADTGAQAQVSGFITDAKDRGMKVGDLVYHHNTGTDITSLHRVAVINANGSADLSNSTTAASGTNSD